MFVAYTSCLRITTTPPSKDILDDDTVNDRVETARAPEHPLAPAVAAAPVAAPAPAATPVVNRGGLASLVRPGFLRLGRHSGQVQERDLERGQVAAAA